MERGRRAARVELAVAVDSLAGRKRRDLDTPLPQLLEHLGLGPHMPVRARTDEQVPRQLLEHVVEVGEDEPMPVRAPPVRDDSLREDDDVPRLLFTVDDDQTEAVSLDPRQSITPRSLRRSPYSLPTPAAKPSFGPAPRTFADGRQPRSRLAGHNRRVRLVPWIPPLFRDRAAAGHALAEAVAALQLDAPVVVGVARGGVAVAVEVARQLEAPVTAIDVERVNAHGLRLGAVTAHGPPYLREGHGVPEEDVESALERARRGAEALEARLELETLPVAGRTTVVVDDGLITGLTLVAACRWARAEEVARLIAATPVGQMDGLARLRDEADLVVCPHPLEEIAVVGQAYDIFDPLDEWYVAGLLADAAGAAE
jgi:putative phosphoribosyl transferase